MSRERTNLWRAVGQTFEWVYGLTNIQFEMAEGRVAEIRHEGELQHYSFEIKTNEARLSGMRHPLALVIESYHMSLTGMLRGDIEDLTFDNGIASIEPDDMIPMSILRDNGGFSTISVVVRCTRFDTGETALSRHFVFRHNQLHLIR